MNPTGFIAATPGMRARRTRLMPCRRFSTSSAASTSVAAPAALRRDPLKQADSLVNIGWVSRLCLVLPTSCTKFTVTWERSSASMSQNT
jgi:hypothetical protein